MRANSTHQGAASARKPVDLALLLELPRSASIAELRRFQRRCPTFEAPVRVLVLGLSSVALLVKPSEADPLRAFLREHPAYRGQCRWERPSPRQAPIVANGRNAVAGEAIRAWRRERDPVSRATSGAGSATSHRAETHEVAAGPGWRHLRGLPAHPLPLRRAGMAFAQRLPQRRKAMGSD